MAMLLTGGGLGCASCQDTIQEAFSPRSLMALTGMDLGCGVGCGSLAGLGAVDCNDTSKWNVGKNTDGTCYTECGGTIISVDCPVTTVPTTTPSSICDDTSLWAVKSVGGKCWNYCTADLANQYEVDASACAIGKSTATGKLKPKTSDINIYLIGGIALAAYILMNQ